MKNSNRALLLSVVIALAGVAGCAEVRASRPDGSTAVDASASDAHVATDDASTTSDAARDDGGSVGGGLVVNEIRPSGGDFIELINTGTSGVDLGGVRIADDEAGAPRIARAFAFPEGIVLAPGDRFVVVCEPTTMMEGLVTGAGCEIDGVTRCIHTDWGISNADGDTVYVVGSDDSVLASANYPGMATAGTVDDQSWCRLPDGTGAFAPCAATPEAVNAAP